MNWSTEMIDAMPDPRRRIMDAIDIALNRDFYGNRDSERAFDALEEIRSIVESIPDLKTCALKAKEEARRKSA